MIFLACLWILIHKKKKTEIFSLFSVSLIGWRFPTISNDSSQSSTAKLKRSAWLCHLKSKLVNSLRIKYREPNIRNFMTTIFIFLFFFPEFLNFWRFINTRIETIKNNEKWNKLMKNLRFKYSRFFSPFYSKGDTNKYWNNKQLYQCTICHSNIEYMQIGSLLGSSSNTFILSVSCKSL